MRHRLGSLLVPLHCVAIFLAFGVMALRAPAQGAMLLVPTWGADGGQPVRLAVLGGARLLKQGPWRDSIVVLGNRAKIEARLAHTGILVLAASPAICGSIPVAGGAS